MKFEEEGLFVGLVSFPFFIDGGAIFKNIFNVFFQKQHREEYLEKLSPGLDPALYNPAAYRMFGNHGLAILALIDDYAFCSRIFNSGHIRVDDDSQCDNMYKSIALTGFSEPFTDSESYLYERAKNTFLLPSDCNQKRYPFIGIIRIKLEYSLLNGKGSRMTTAIKKRIEELKEIVRTNIKEKALNKKTEVFLESIVVDAHDNDEMFAVAFSNSIHSLDTYLKEIRRIAVSDLDLIDFKLPPKRIEHVCASCHMSYGYHYEFSFKRPDSGTFLHWDKESDSLSDQSSAYSVNCLIETKPGHRKDFCDYLNSIASDFSEKMFTFSKTVTGGSIVHFRIPLEEVETLHQLASSNSSGFRRHIRRIKLTLNDNHQHPNEPAEKHDHCDGEVISNLLDNEFIQGIKTRLTEIGISKIVRERLLSLLDLFNDCGRNKLHLSYFRQLEPAIRNLIDLLDGFQENGESLLRIENKLNEEISALETAFYNRMHNKMTPNTVLEYGGGIQQFLQAFGFAYREVVRVLSPSEAPKNYTMVTGVSKESSSRTHTELNINHIIYPQLFCVTTWKEASNFTIRLLDNSKVLTEKGNEFLPKTAITEFDVFRSFIKSKEVFAEILNLMIAQTDLMRSDAVFQMIKSILTPEAIKYSLHDYLAYHFAFCRDFELMWRYYLKIFLQTPSVYLRRGIIDKKQFVFVLLRLLLVAFREQDTMRKQHIMAFLKNQRFEPFDSSMSEIWLESFEKIESIAQNMCKNLQSYGYSNVSDNLIAYSEYQLAYWKSPGYASYLVQNGYDPVNPPKTTSEAVSIILGSRIKHIDSIVTSIEDGSFDGSVFDDSLNSPDNTISLMSAFLILIDNLDRDKGNKDIVAYTVPRNYKSGDIDYAILESILPYASNILADPIGGFVIPNHEIRKTYFAYRTLLYRSLWDLSYRSAVQQL